MSYIGNSPGVASQRVETTFTATASQTVFTPSSGYTLGYCDVYYNGVKLVNGDDYTAADGVSITLATAAAAGDSVVVVASFPRGLSDGYLKAEADAKYVALTGDQTIAGVKTFSGSATIVNGNLGVGTSSVLGNSTFNAALGIAVRNQSTSMGYFQTYNANAGSNLKTWRFGGDGSGNLVFETVNDAYSSATGRLTLGATGNLSLAYTPSAWGSAYKIFQIGSAAILANDSGASDLYSNVYYDGTNFRYMANGYGSIYSFSGGQHRWYAMGNNTSGAGAVGSYVQNMALSASGDLALGNDVPRTGGASGKWLTFYGAGTGYSGGPIYVDGTATKAYHYYQNNYLVSQGQSGVGMKFTVNGGTSDVLIDTSGNLVLPSGSGISFAATGNGSGSMSSEILSDYEEGTWTPVWNGGGTLGASRCRYTKIGRMVTLHATLDMGNNVNGGAFQISGLPYGSGTNVEAVGAIMSSNVDFPSGYTMLTLYWYGGSNYVQPYWSGNNIGWTNLTNAQAAYSSIIFTITYEAA